jgi:MOSC domain-containing protein YiiM
MGEPRWVRRFTERGRTGAYLAVRTPGTIAPGDPVEVIERPSHGFTVPELFRAWSGDRDLAAALLVSDALHPVVRAELAARQP